MRIVRRVFQRLQFNYCAVLEHEHAVHCSGVAGIISVPMRRRDERGTFRLSSSRAPRAPLIDRGLLRLILRRVRQRAFVILNPRQIAPVDPAVAHLAPEIMLSFADAPPVGALAEYRPANLGSSIVMIAVICRPSF
jgi:hypothetical protein